TVLLRISRWEAGGSKPQSSVLEGRLPSDESNRPIYDRDDAAPPEGRAMNKTCHSSRDSFRTSIPLQTKTMGRNWNGRSENGA
ncbi:hypothetical protein PENTCL1PPCAC_8896, partial [Pristionchus entomophagus]